MNNKFILCDHEQINCIGVCSILKEMYPSCETIYCPNFRSVCEEIKDKHYDLLICEINFPELPVLSSLSKIKEIKPMLKILIFSSYSEHIFAIRYLKVGADGFISKKRSLTDLQYAIKLLMENNKYISPDLVYSLIGNIKSAHNGFERLSNRELDVATLLAHGQGLLEISNQLNIHVSTVSTYKIRILKKMNIPSIRYLIEHLGKFSLSA